jgi:glutathione S-transferase
VNRWGDDANWSLLKPVIFAQLPFPVSLFVPDLVRKSILKDAYSQGIARYSQAEMHHLAELDIQAISAIIADKPYVLGDQPSSYDAVLFGALCNILYPPFTSHLKTLTQSCQNLVCYTDRIRADYFSDLPQ